VPGSFADRGHPEALVYGDASERMFRGTGTSQSAAVVSGTVALLLQRNPELTPDQVKGVLVASADRLPEDPSPVQGAGQIDAKGALEILKQGNVPAYTQTHPRSTGLGSLDLSRGGSAVVDPEDGTRLGGEQDVFSTAWDAAAWAQASSAGNAWEGGTWRSVQWAGDGWDGATWQGRTWSGRTWSGRTWSGRTWSTMSFLGRTWSGDDWTGRTWSGDGWSGRTWSTDDAW
jgi:serine protease AprX